MSELLSKINGTSIKKAPIYYIGWFKKLYLVEIIIKEKWRGHSSSGWPITYYKYVIKFENGKTKYVKSNKLIMEGDN